MYSDPGANYEGVGIDDVHVFDKAPVFTDSLVTSLSKPVNGSAWIDFNENGQRILSINPNGQNLGNTRISMYRDTGSIRDTAGQYYGERNWIVQTTSPATAAVGVRYYFTDSEANQLIGANSCASCINMEDAYSSGITQYSSTNHSEEDSSLRNNQHGIYVFHKLSLESRSFPMITVITPKQRYRAFRNSGSTVGAGTRITRWPPGCSILQLRLPVRPDCWTGPAGRKPARQIYSGTKCGQPAVL